MKTNLVLIMMASLLILCGVIAKANAAQVICVANGTVKSTGSYTISEGSVGCLSTKKIDVTVMMEYKAQNRAWMQYNYVRRVTLNPGYTGRVFLACRPPKQRTPWKFRTVVMYTAYGKKGYSSKSATVVSPVRTVAC